MRLNNWKLNLILFLTIGFLTSCHTTKKISSHPGHPEVEDIHIGKGTKTQNKIVDEAMTWLGTPYKYAHSEKGKGTDCSGLVMEVYKESVGEKIPRNSAKQAEYCTPVNADDVKKGDLVFFATGKDRARVSHVGIIVDDESFIHASSSKGVVVSKLANKYYKTRFIMYGRVPRNKNLLSENQDN